MYIRCLISQAQRPFRLHKMIPVASKINSFVRIRHYFPGRFGRHRKTRSGDLLRESHPSEDLSELPPLHVLWLGRGTIVDGCGHGEAACQSRFGMDGNRFAPYLAVFYETLEREKACRRLLCRSAGGLRASFASLVPFFSGHIR